MLPVHNSMDLKPQLPLPRLTRSSNIEAATTTTRIRDCVLNYLSNPEIIDKVHLGENGQINDGLKGLGHKSQNHGSA
jgi:hypothetical protein